MPMCWITEVFFQTSWVSKLSPNPSQGPHALSPETCSSVAVCLAGLPPPARRQPAVPEVSGCLPQSLEVKSPACPTSTHRAPGAVCSAEPELGEPGFGSWNPRLLGSPGQHPTKQTSVSVLSLPMWSPNECQPPLAVKWMNGLKIYLEIFICCRDEDVWYVYVYVGMGNCFLLNHRYNSHKQAIYPREMNADVRMYA